MAPSALSAFYRSAAEVGSGPAKVTPCRGPSKTGSGINSRAQLVPLSSGGGLVVGEWTPAAGTLTLLVSEPCYRGSCNLGLLDLSSAHLSLGSWRPVALGPRSLIKTRNCMEHFLFLEPGKMKEGFPVTRMSMNIRLDVVLNWKCSQMQVHSVFMVPHKF